MTRSEKRLLAIAVAALAACSIALCVFLELSALAQLRSEGLRLSDRIVSLKAIEAKSTALMEEYRSLKSRRAGGVAAPRGSALGDAIGATLKANGVILMSAQVRMGSGSLASVTYAARGSPFSLIRSLKEIERGLDLPVESFSIDASVKSGDANASFTVRY